MEEGFKIRNISRIALVALLLLSIDLCAADSWWAYISTPKSSWSINRESIAINFEYSQSIDGKISPVEFNGRELKPYFAKYVGVKANDVRTWDRTAALEGSLSSDESLRLKSSTLPERLCEGDAGDYCEYCQVCDVPCCYPYQVSLAVWKHSGDSTFNIPIFEKWPVVINESKTLLYQGKGINQRDFSGNNMDYAGSNFLYNKELAEDLSINLSLSRMNITAEGTDTAINSVELKTTKDLDYRIKAHTTGIADLSYRQASGTYDFKHKTYPDLAKGDERYYGTYDIERKVKISSKHAGEACNTTDPDLQGLFNSWCECFTQDKSADSWLPCCQGGWSDMSYIDKNGHSADGIFDCTCRRASGVLYL